MNERYEKVRGVVSITRTQARRMARDAIERMTDEEDARLPRRRWPIHGQPLTEEQLSQLPADGPGTARSLTAPARPARTAEIKTTQDPDRVAARSRYRPTLQEARPRLAVAHQCHATQGAETAEGRPQAVMLGEGTTGLTDGLSPQTPMRFHDPKGVRWRKAC